MILHLKSNDLVQLRRAAGVAIEVLAGQVWITEDGAAADAFLTRGRCFRVAGDGLVLVGAEGGTGGAVEISMAPPSRQPRSFAARIAGWVRAATSAQTQGTRMS